MRKTLLTIAAALSCGIALLWATQDTTLDQRDVRDPRKLEVWLEANASDAETRIAAVEAMALTNTTLTDLTLLSNAALQVYCSNVTVTANGTISGTAGFLANDTVREADLMAVDSASDEDFLSYEATTGDFEWHSAAEIAGKFAEGNLADSIVVSADIKDGEVSEADLKAVDSATDEDILTYEVTTGDFEWHSIAEIAAKFTEGVIADSTIVGADILDGTITAADLGADSVAASELASDSVTKDCMSAEDFGDFTAGADGTCSLDDDVVAAAEMADADHGDITWASGVASIDSGAVLASELGAGTLPSNVVFSNDVASVTASNLTLTGTATLNGPVVLGDGGDPVTVYGLQTNAPGAVVGSVVDNLPTGCETNATWLVVHVQGVTNVFLIPAYMMP